MLPIIFRKTKRVDVEFAPAENFWQSGGSKPPPYNKGVWALPDTIVASNGAI